MFDSISEWVWVFISNPQHTRIIIIVTGVIIAYIFIAVVIKFFKHPWLMKHDISYKSIYDNYKGWNKKARLRYWDWQNYKPPRVPFIFKIFRI